MDIAELIEKDIAFMASDWVEDETVVDGPMEGFRYAGEKPAINCNDVFYWGCADSEYITVELLPLFNEAVDDCDGNLEMAANLYCARIRKERPQGAMYTYIPEELWPLFDECGPEREIDMGNPCKQGEYQQPKI